MNDSFAPDRCMRISNKQVVRTGWVSIDLIIMANRDRMAVGDVDRAFQKVLQRGVDCAGWPPPVGYWQKLRFVITDGRHEYLASLMLGATQLFVAWIEEIEAVSETGRPIRSLREDYP